MDYLLNLDEYNQKSEEFCDICFEQHDKTSITLKCNHKFHYHCILESLKNKRIRNKSVRSCPYCRQNSGFLPLLYGVKPIKHIHYIKKKKNVIKCSAIIKNGKRKGKKCTHNVITGSMFCGKHKNYLKK